LLRLSGQGGAKVALRGSANILPHIAADRFLGHRFYLQSGSKARLVIGPGALVNNVADPDICPGALAILARIVRKLSRGCFNHPAAVLATARHKVAQQLSGIPGLVVPRAIVVEAPTPDVVRAAVARHGLAYPILVRVAGTHAGKSLMKVDAALETEKIGRLPLRGRRLYCTEFRDFSDPDGRYRKFRVSVIGEEIVLRHCIIADHWLLHATKRAAQTGAEEQAMFDAFDGPRAAHLRPLFREIGRRLGLDYLGVDCHIDSNGRVLLFEANACMNILLNTSPSPNIWDAPIGRIKAALNDRLARPSSWYAPAPGDLPHGLAAASP